VNGFESHSLKNCVPKTEAKKQIEEIISEKFIVTVAGENDFKSMDLKVKNYHVFDLQVCFINFLWASVVIQMQRNFAHKCYAQLFVFCLL